MRDIKDNTVIQILITSACDLSCANCTQMVGHVKPRHMSLQQIQAAVESLLDFPGRVGIFGGSPTLHPKFLDILNLFREMLPIERREFWCTDFKWGEYEGAIKGTFLPDRIHFNNHITEDGRHRPLLIAIEDAVEDPELRRQLIDNCPFQTHWSAMINRNGAYACEIAAALDDLFDLGIAWPIEPGWWKRTVSDYEPMIEHACSKCSGALPMPSRSDGRGGRDGPTIDVISPSNLERLKAVGSPKVARGHYELFDRKLTRADIEKYADLNPRAFRSFVSHSPEDTEKAIAQ